MIYPEFLKKGDLIGIVLPTKEETYWLGCQKYLEQELNEDYPELLTYLQTVENSAAGAYNAAWYWCWYYEIPAQREEQTILRGELALQKYPTTVEEQYGYQALISDMRSLLL